MKFQEWVLAILAGGGLLLMNKKTSAINTSYVADRLINAYPLDLGVKATETNLKVMGYTDYIWSSANKFNIAPKIIAAIIDTESSGNPSAVRQEPALKDYSVGLMQLLTSTAGFVKKLFPQIEYTGDPKTLNNPKINIELGTAYLRYQLDRYTKTPVIKPITDMIAAYNAGTARENDRSYVNSKGLTNVQQYVDKVVEKAYRYEIFFVYLFGYEAYEAKFPTNYWNFR